MEAVLKIENLNKYFGTRKILDDISFEVYAGEVFGFLGPNGAGKTTTIKIIMGFLEADSGNITVGGYNHKKDYEKVMANLGGIVENPEMYKNLSGYTNLKMYARLHDDVSDERINEVVEIVKLQNRIKGKVKTYSLGMKQRLGLAQSMVHKPRVLILDEPTNGLDPAGIKEMRDILRNLAHKENVAVFVSSHMLSEMEHMCDRVGIINNGKLIGVKKIDELINESVSKVTYKIFTKQAEKAGELLKAQYEDKVLQINENYIEIETDEENIMNINLLLAQNMILISEIKKTEVSLEDAFMNITGGGGAIE